MRPDKDFAYWIGLAQSDGCLKRNKTKNTTVQFYVQFDNRNLALVKRFQELVKSCLGREIQVWPRKRGGYECKVGVNTLLDEFDKLDINFSDPPKPPKWIIDSPELFCAYLAGIIDGDGDIRIRRPAYPQCVVRITSSKPQNELAKAMRSSFCECSISNYAHPNTIEGREIFSRYSRLEFCISNKNMVLIKKYLLPYLTSKHKYDRIASFLKV